MRVDNVILTPLRADGTPDTWSAVAVPWRGFVGLDFGFAAEGMIDDVRLVNEQQATVLWAMRRREMTFSAPMTEEEALRVVALLAGPGLVREWQEDMADLARWADEGGYCP